MPCSQPSSMPSMRFELRWTSSVRSRHTRGRTMPGSCPHRGAHRRRSRRRSRLRGLDVHRAARIAATAHGGQVVVSEATAALVDRLLPDDHELEDLGKHRLKDLADAETIFQVHAPGIAERFPPLKTLERTAHNLPVQVTSFVGREEEIQEAIRMLQSARILTLLGPGGTGKSRLALQIAAECAEHFPDGTFFVPLAPVTDPNLVPSTILGALGVPASTRSRSPREHLLDFFTDRSSLLLLDNFEQIIDGGEVVSELVRRSPDRECSSPRGSRCGSPESRRCRFGRSRSTRVTPRPLLR